MWNPNWILILEYCHNIVRVSTLVRIRDGIWSFLQPEMTFLVIFFYVIFVVFNVLDDFSYLMMIKLCT